ncbi:replication initiation protein [Yinghuangia sp. KLBMP8922]|uniref:Replication initiation protein n=1 Tax=Yinghuangia soli TaxID=2908204 RepID=A0AA41U6U7_9ACTN|nr:replication initiator [Yinghuangia soli]MCF2531329.1 replication initiation protein [Yinghuangia soli]
MARAARHGRSAGLFAQLERLGGCADPIRLDGHRTDIDTTSGEIVHTVTAHDLPAGALLVRCNNRRTTRCPACAETYRRDTYHLISAGLAGGKGVPDDVAAHPRVFVTLTAPSFGPVHNRPDSGRCRCGTRHRPDAAELGTPLDLDTYDYTAAVLWNAHAGALWARFSIELRRALAAAVGLTQRVCAELLRPSFAKVAEYQRRGAVHFHAVIRLDAGRRAGDDITPPPDGYGDWHHVLESAVRVAAGRARVPGPDAEGTDLPSHFVFGRQVDVRPIRSNALADGPLTDRSVAGYIAKYATKGAETATGTLDRRIASLADLDRHDLTDHARRLVAACWTLGTRPGLEHLLLRKWAHMLGFRGHFTTKSRCYSTTLGALRAVRMLWNETRRRAAAEAAGHPLPDPDTTLVLAHWEYAGHGHTAGESLIAAGLDRTRQLGHEAAREARAERDEEGADDAR